MQTRINTLREALVRRVAELFGNQAQAAAALGVSQSTISRALDPGASEKQVMTLQARIDNWLRQQSPAHIASEAIAEYDIGRRTSNEHTRAVEQYVLPIPVYEPMETNGERHDVVVRDVREMERAYGPQARLIRRRYMMGDAMRGSIMPGAEVDCIPVEDYQGPGLYYMHLDDRPIIARLQPVGGGGWLIKYDSAEYEDEMLLPDERGGYTSRLSGLTVRLRIHERVGGYRVTS